MPTTSNFGWTTPADTDLVKDGAAAIRTLGNGVDSSFVDLKGGTTGQVLSKASNTDLDFSWIAVDPLTILDAKGDLISATAADTPARLAVGTNGQVLTADSTTSTGLKWAAPASGGKVLQVVQGTTSTYTAITSSTFTDTNLSASITPSATSSKILVFINQAVGMFKNTNADVEGTMRLVRGSTEIFAPGTRFFNIKVNNYAEFFYPSLHYLDSPSSTSSLTYKTQFRLLNTTNDATAYLNYESTTAVMTLIEIGA
jgi:hypothetical protein